MIFTVDPLVCMVSLVKNVNYSEKAIYIPALKMQKFICLVLFTLLKRKRSLMIVTVGAYRCVKNSVDVYFSFHQKRFCLLTAVDRSLTNAR